MKRDLCIILAGTLISIAIFLIVYKLGIIDLETFKMGKTRVSKKTSSRTDRK
jgi:hypothetical protein